MRTRLTALVVALAVLVLGAAPASAAQLTGRSNHGVHEAYGASANVTVKSSFGHVTSYTWKDKGKDGYWSKDKKHSKKDKDKSWDKGKKKDKGKDKPECVCDDDHGDAGKHKDWKKIWKKDWKKGHKGKHGWHWGGWDKCRDHDEPGTPDEGEEPDTEVPGTPDEETPEPETPEVPEVPDTEEPDTQEPDTEEPDTEAPDTETPDEDVVEDSDELDSTVTAPTAPTAPTVSGGNAPAATPVVAEPTFAG